MIGGIVAAAFAGLRLAPFPGPWFFYAAAPGLSFLLDGYAMNNNIENLKSTGLKATLPRLKIMEIFQTGK